MDEKLTLRSISNFIARIRSDILVSFFYFAGIISLGVASSLSTSTALTYRYILLFLPFMFWGIAGVIMIVRQEAYLILRFEGVVAIIFGIFVVLLNIILALIPILGLVKLYYNP